MQTTGKLWPAAVPSIQVLARPCCVIDRATDRLEQVGAFPSTPPIPIARIKLESAGQQLGRQAFLEVLTEGGPDLGGTFTKPGTPQHTTGGKRPDTTTHQAGGVYT